MKSGKSTIQAKASSFLSFLSFLKSGLSLPYFSLASLWEILGQGEVLTFFSGKTSLTREQIYAKNSIVGPKEKWDEPYGQYENKPKREKRWTEILTTVKGDSVVVMHPAHAWSVAIDSKIPAENIIMGQERNLALDNENRKIAYKVENEINRLRLERKRARKNLASRLTTFFAVLGIGGGIFFSAKSINLTGNTIGIINNSTFSWIGIVLLAIGLVSGILCLKKRKI